METPKPAYKGARSTITEAVLAYNGVYERGKSIAKNAVRDFKDDPAKVEQFSYAHVLKLQGEDKGDDNNGNTPTPPTT